jgi:hypothetical protein
MHSVFTIVCTVQPTLLPRLRAELAAVNADPAANTTLPFGTLGGVHFASITIFEPGGALAPFVVFENNIDGGIGPYLTKLGNLPDLWRIFSCADDFPGGNPREVEMRPYLATHVHTPDVFHVGTPYRNVGNIVRDRTLRARLERCADAIPAGTSAREAWQQLRAKVAAPISLDRAMVANVSATGDVAWVPAHEPRLWSRIVSWSIFAALAVMTVAITEVVDRRLWPHPMRLTAVTAGVAAAIGAWNAILVGWPLPGHWRHFLNITAWFAVAGAALGLLPFAVRLLNIGWPWPLVTIAPWLLALLSAVSLFAMGGYWDVPAADEGGFDADPVRMAHAIAQEDCDVQNHMSALVMLRGGRIRLWSLQILLWIMKHTWFPTVLRDVYGGRLFGLPTVHFAQWVTLGNGRYIFLSNYDHSWSRYLDDFGSVSYGLARLWGQGRNSPGLGSLTRFKEYARSWMTPYSVWYRAYPGVAVTEIWNNEAIRCGLLGPADDRKSLQLLRRLAAGIDR